MIKEFTEALEKCWEVLAAFEKESVFRILDTLKYHADRAEFNAKPETVLNVAEAQSEAPAPVVEAAPGAQPAAEPQPQPAPVDPSQAS